MRHFRLACIAIAIILAAVPATAEPPAEKAPMKEKSEETVVREHVRRWLAKGFKDPGEVNPASLYGAAVLPAAAEILAAPENLTSHEIRRGLILVKLIGQRYSALRPVLIPYLQAEEWAVRLSAVEALASVGTLEDAPVFVAMLYDSNKSVRYAAIMALGKTGDESALMAIKIWEKQALKADMQRPHEERWLVGAIHEQINESKLLIERRE